MTTTVKVTAPGYAGKKSVVYTAQPGGDWQKHAVLTEGQSIEVVACDGAQQVCVKEFTDAEYAEAFPED